MMSKKQLAAMLTLHIIYLLLGASIFYTIESPLEIEERIHDRLERIEIQNLLYDNYVPADPDKQDDILRKLSDYCGKSMFNYTSEEEEPPVKWDFYHSFFFSYTVVSTIGYGNLAPTTSLSRILMIFYALFGIPINGILLANLGEYFGKQIINVYSKYHKNHEARANKLDVRFHRLGMFGQIVLYLIPGFLFFIFLPACLFMVFEGWDYVASIYYAFVTLTTIGFGDLVAGTINNGFGTYFLFYKIFLIIWITFGLGYIVMLLGFITSGMRSKHIHMLEHKLVQNIKATQSRVLKGFSRDVGYLRRIINEAYLMKFKPVYCEEEFPRLYKSASCPIFTFDIEPRDPIIKRKRANSENIYLSARDMLRIQSDTDLLGIDKDRTFTAAAIVKPAELLARVVNALGVIDEPESEDEGQDMFSDEDILRSEKPLGWTIGKEHIFSDSPKSQRGRALSVDVSNYRKDSSGKLDMAWPNGETPKSRRHGKLSLPTDGKYPLEEDVEEESEQPKSMLSRLNPFRKRGEEEESPATYLKNTVRGRLSLFSSGGDAAPKHRFHPDLPGLNEDPRSQYGEDVGTDLATDIQKYQNKTKKGRGSLFPSFGRDRKNSKDDSVTELPMDVQSYQNKTKRGRASLFPSFGKDKKNNDDEEKETDLASDIQKYQNKTKRGRGSLFPSFNLGMSQAEEEEEDTDFAADILKYQKMTQRGRTSLFPSFDMGRTRDEDTLPDLTSDILSYQNKTKRGRGSLFSGDLENYRKATGGGRKSIFSPDVDVSELPEPAQAEMLEQTTVADLIRALAVLHSSPPSAQRKHGTAHPPPGLLDRFASDMAATPGSAGTRRRGSVHPGFADLPAAVGSGGPPGVRRRGSVRPDFANLFTPEPPGSSTPAGTRRRGSIRPDLVLPPPVRAEPDDPLSGARRRRISVRQNAPAFTPSLATVTSGTELRSSPPEDRQRKISMHELPPPSYTDLGGATETPRARRFSPAAGGGAAGGARRTTRTSPVPRMFSRMRKESVEEEPTPPSETRSRQSSLTDVVVDDNKNT